MQFNKVVAKYTVDYYDQLYYVEVFETPDHNYMLGVRRVDGVKSYDIMSAKDFEYYFRINIADTPLAKYFNGSYKPETGNKNIVSGNIGNIKGDFHIGDK